MNWRKIPKKKREEIMAQYSQTKKATCPECNTNMVVLGLHPSTQNKPEAYCGPCHLSIPFFNAEGF